MKIKKNLRDAAFIAVLAVFLFIPSAKAFLMSGLMCAGLFQPDVKTPIKTEFSLSQTGIKFKDRNGRIVDLQQLEGKVVFINIWATWCPPCLAELPSINKLYQKYQSDINVAFLMVDADGDLTKSGSLFNRRGYQMPLYARYTDLPQSLLNGTIPTTLVFDKRGKLVYRQEGAANYNSAQFIKFMETLKSK